MGLFKKKSEPKQPQESQHDRAPSAPDPRLPGSAGYRGFGQKKNAMPEHRFQFVRPDQRDKG